MDTSAVTTPDTTTDISTQYARRQTVRICSRELSEAIKAKGYSLERLTRDHGLPCGKSYLSKALVKGKINPDILQLICIVLGKNPSDFLYRSQERHTKYRKMPGNYHKPRIDPEIGYGANGKPYRILTDQETEVLVGAIIIRAKEDFMLAYRTERDGGKYYKPEGTGAMMTTRSIEEELNGEWFKEHIVGALTENKQAVDMMLDLWRKEAEEGVVVNRKYAGFY